MKFTILHKPHFLGLDIQAHDMQLLQLKENRNQWEVVKSASYILPESVNLEGNHFNLSLLSNTLLKMVAEQELKNAYIAVSLPNHLIRMKRVVLPYAVNSNNDVIAEVELQIRKELPGMNDALSIDYHILNDRNASQSEICFVATRQTYVQQYVHCLTESGLIVKVVDAEICAVYRIMTTAIARLLKQTRLTSVLIFYFQIHYFAIVKGDDKGITFFQQINLSAHEGIEHIVHKMHQYLQSLNEIINSYICGDHPYLFEVYEKIKLSKNAISYLNPFLYLNSEKKANIVNLPVKFIVAAGLAMRERARW